MTTVFSFGLRDPVLLLVFPALLALWWRFGRRTRMGLPSPALVLLSASHADPLPRSLRQRLAFVPPALLTLALACAVLALARPVHSVRLPREREGIDITLVLDRSSSMSEREPDRDGVATERLALVKASAASFVEGRPGDRIAMVSFARYPDLVSPHTTDHSALLELLADVDFVEADTAEDLTGIGTALAFAIDLLRSSGSASKLCVLLTDGDENVATERSPEEIRADEAVELARSLGVRVYTILAGEGRRGLDGRLEEVDASLLESIARTTEGQFFRAGDEAALRASFGRIDELETSPFTVARIELEDRAETFLALAIAALLSSFALSHTLFRRLP